MQRGEAPQMRASFDQQATQRTENPAPAPPQIQKTPTPQDRLAAFREAAPRTPPRDTLSQQKAQTLFAQDRLERLRRGTRDSDREPDLER
jgi:hypothetical protein